MVISALISHVEIWVPLKILLGNPGILEETSKGRWLGQQMGLPLRPQTTQISSTFRGMVPCQGHKTRGTMPLPASIKLLSKVQLSNYPFTLNASSETLESTPAPARVAVRKCMGIFIWDKHVNLYENQYQASPYSNCTAGRYL